MSAFLIGVIVGCVAGVVVSTFINIKNKTR